MKDTVKYIVVSKYSQYDLQRNVNDMISKGWVPIGGISVVFHSNFRENWAQAMIKTET